MGDTDTTSTDPAIDLSVGRTPAGGHDAHGNPMSGDAATIELYDRAIDQFVRFQPGVIDDANVLLAADDPVPMASALGAYLHLMSTELGDLETAANCHRAMVASTLGEREAHHARAIGNWLDGDWRGAATALDALLERWPTDVLALMLGHQLDFFVGDAHNLRDRPIRSLRAFDPQHPHVGFVRGMAAFGLEESGHYGQALEAGLAAVAKHPEDVWAVHAVAHTYEMQGLVDSAVTFMTSTDTRWETGNLFTVHNWWHLGLFHLEAGRLDRVLEIYDREIHHDGSSGVALEMLDASAMLWRLFLDDVDAGARAEVLADAWLPATDLEPWYVFNDLHAVMALAAAGQLADAHRVIDRLTAWLPTARGTNALMTAEVGLAACRAIVAFAEDRHADVIDELLPIRRELNTIGGSHAQRDALQRTLLESTLRSGRFELARALGAERLGVRESSVYGWTQWARTLRGLGDDRAADDAAATAALHRTRFATVG